MNGVNPTYLLISVVILCGMWFFGAILLLALGHPATDISVLTAFVLPIIGVLMAGKAWIMHHAQNTIQENQAKAEIQMSRMQADVKDVQHKVNGSLGEVVEQAVRKAIKEPTKVDKPQATRKRINPSDQDTD
jgi:hypothetical protein